MASWTSPVLHSVGDALAVSDWNGLANDATFLYQAPYANYFNSVATSLPNTSTTQVTLGGTTTSGYGFSVSSNNAVVPLAGTYWVAYSLGCAGASSGKLFAEVDVNGSSYGIGSGSPIDATFGGNASGATIAKLSASNTLGLFGFQSSGGALNTQAAANSSFLVAAFIGSQ